MSTTPPPARLFWRTTALPDGALPRAPGAPGARALTSLLEGRDDVVCWLREGRGLVGWGRALTLRAQGPDRIEELRRSWRATVYASWWRDALVRPGTGPVALGTITFAPSSADSSVLVVPEVLVGADDRGAWLTVCAPSEEALPDEQDVLDSLRAPGRGSGRLPDRAGQAVAPGPAESGTAGCRVREGSLSAEQWQAAVRLTQERMAAGEADKVVLARDVVAEPTAPLSTGQVLGRLAESYPSCWTFAVDSMVGATPELLVRLQGRHLSSRVLAGTARRTGRSRSAPHPRGEVPASADPQEAAAWLLGSAKNNAEHTLARDSAVAALEPLCSVVEVGERHALVLPNVLHLATDITGVVAGDTGALSLVGALHPTAAVGGTPTAAAVGIIDQVEGMDRGRYAGPVGWVDWHGEGQWCIALRSARLRDDAAGLVGPGAPARVFGGGGIMPGSDPADELAETCAKMRPVLTALGAKDLLSPPPCAQPE